MCAKILGGGIILIWWKMTRGVDEGGGKAPSDRGAEPTARGSLLGADPAAGGRRLVVSADAAHLGRLAAGEASCRLPREVQLRRVGRTCFRLAASRSPAQCEALDRRSCRRSGQDSFARPRRRPARSERGPAKRLDRWRCQSGREAALADLERSEAIKWDEPEASVAKRGGVSGEPASREGAGRSPLKCVSRRAGAGRS